MIRSTRNMILKLEGMSDTIDLKHHENKFVQDLAAKLRRAEESGVRLDLSEKQLEWLGDLYERHFGD